MNIRYVSELDEVDWQKVSQIISIVGWGERSTEKLEHAFKHSSFVRFAYVDDQLVGMGRTVDDGVYYGWIVDLAILPEYQGKGIGSFILKELETDLQPFVTTMLTAAKGKSGFYENRGWLQQTAAYIWPRSENQKRLFSEYWEVNQHSFYACSGHFRDDLHSSWTVSGLEVELPVKMPWADGSESTLPANSRRSP